MAARRSFEAQVTRHRRALGADAENRVEEALLTRGLQCIARNVYAGGGELDLICREISSEVPPFIVFVEVRSRKSLRFGSPALSVGASKQAHLIRAATAWLVRTGLYGRCAVRFDVVAVVGTADEPAKYRIEWITNAFSAF